MSPRHARGFTLVELMVAVAIGLVITLAGVAMYLSTSRAAMLQREMAHMSADAQGVFALLGPQLRMSGYRALRQSAGGLLPPFTATGLEGCRGAYQTPNMETTGCVQSASGADSVLVRYEADAGDATTAMGTPVDCQGNPITAIALPAALQPAAGGPVTFYLMENRYYLLTGPKGDLQLVCSGSGGTAPFTTSTPLAGGVEAFQITYTATPPAGAAPARDNAISLLNTFGGNPAVAWPAVSAVSVCITLVSSVNVQSSSYWTCDGTVAKSKDGKLRKSFTATFTRRNTGA